MTTQNYGAGPGLRHGVRDHVRALGDSPSEVARRLGTHGVRGVPGQASECAIARYLQAVVGSESTVKKVVVMERTLRVRRTGWRPPLVVRMPRGASAFVRAFDAGCYPELVDIEADTTGPVTDQPGDRSVGQA